MFYYSLKGLWWHLEPIAYYDSFHFPPFLVRLSFTLQSHFKNHILHVSCPLYLQSDVAGPFLRPHGATRILQTQYFKKHTLMTFFVSLRKHKLMCRQAPYLLQHWTPNKQVSWHFIDSQTLVKWISEWTERGKYTSTILSGGLQNDSISLTGYISSSELWWC